MIGWVGSGSGVTRRAGRRATGCGTCRPGRTGGPARRSRRAGRSDPAGRPASVVKSLPQCGRGANGARRSSTAAMTGAHRGRVLDPGEVDGQAVAPVARAQPQVVGGDGAQLADLQHRRDPVADLGHRRQSARPRRRAATRYSDCSSSPALGVNSSRKCGSRSYHGPGTPSCCVQWPVGMPGTGWRGPSAAAAPSHRCGGAGWPADLLEPHLVGRPAAPVGEQADAVAGREQLVEHASLVGTGRSS